MRSPPPVVPVKHGVTVCIFQGIDLAITSVTSLLVNQSVASESERARNRCQRAVVTPGQSVFFVTVSPLSSMYSRPTLLSGAPAFIYMTIHMYSFSEYIHMQPSYVH